MAAQFVEASRDSTTPKPKFQANAKSQSNAIANHVLATMRDCTWHLPVYTGSWESVAVKWPSFLPLTLLPIPVWLRPLPKNVTESRRHNIVY